jgi:hypothetical protein
VAPARTEAKKDSCDPERRQGIRFPCDLEVACQPIEPKQGPAWQSQGRDISVGGIGVIAPRAIEAGTLLEVRLRNPRRKFVCARLLLVIYTRNEGEGVWVVGGNFYTDLSFEEIQALRS